MTIYNTHLGIRVPNQIKEELEQYAEQELISVSDILRQGLMAQLEIRREKMKSKWSV